ncbi:hypothetical protein [Salinibacterium sp. M195]|uniref:hypothetical protein n=1 Tax=Salinibacterium sp. M195 TaxID=2583374 RepID=UPI001C635589|nr:hypothetical protein [Salinibacterium sp. M195]QYH36389.1 hypothetical protein FFT87_10745 [Salinibacterium sp. M195]
MATSQLSISHKAVYVKQQPLASQLKFLEALCNAPDAEWSYGDEYGRKLRNGVKPLTHDAQNTFPATIDSAEAARFRRRCLAYATLSPEVLTTRRSVIAANAGLPTTLDTDRDGFIPALADWSVTIIKELGDSDTLAATYQRRLEGESDPASSAFTSLYGATR